MHLEGAHHGGHHAAQQQLQVSGPGWRGQPQGPHCALVAMHEWLYLTVVLKVQKHVSMLRAAPRSSAVGAELLLTCAAAAAAATGSWRSVAWCRG